MQMQSVFGALSAPILNLSSQRSLSGQFRIGRYQALKNNKFVGIASNSGLQLRLSGRFKEPFVFEYRLKRVTTSCCSSSDVEPVYREKSAAGLPNDRSTELDPFRGKSGSVSFHGVTHQFIEARKIESAPFAADQGSLFWLVAPVALISSFVLPQLLGNAIAGLFNVTLAAFVSSIFSEAMFYFGVATFLGVTDGVQRPYLEFSPKRWGLITGLRGYLLSAYLTMGFKVVIPLFMVSVFWPFIGVQAVVAVAPFLAGCLAQLYFEKSLDKRGLSCWPLVPIIFEVYRLYQLTKAASYVEMLMYGLSNLPQTPELFERSGALTAMIVCFQALGLICLWSLVTFLLRLFPSRPVSENY